MEGILLKPPFQKPPRDPLARTNLNVTSLKTTPEGIIQASKGGRQPTVLPTDGTYEPHGQAAWRTAQKVQ